MLILVAMAFTTNNEKLLKVELSRAKWDHHFDKLNDVKAYINATNLPHQDVRFITLAIDSLLMDLRAQLLPQIDTVKKK